MQRLDAELAVCRIPTCDGDWHRDGTCAVRLPEVEFSRPDVVLTSELLADAGEAPQITAFVFNMTSGEARREMRDRAAASEFTSQLRRLAAAIDGAAAFLPA